MREVKCGRLVAGNGSLCVRRLAGLESLLARITGRVETSSEENSGVRVTPGSAVPRPLHPHGRHRFHARRSRRPAPAAPATKPRPSPRRTPARVGSNLSIPPQPAAFPDEHAEAATNHLHVVHGLALVRTGHRRGRADRWSTALPGPTRRPWPSWVRPWRSRPGSPHSRRTRRLSLLATSRATAESTAAAAVTLLTAGRANLVDKDLTTWINWAPWSFAANTVAGQALGDGPALP